MRRIATTLSALGFLWAGAATLYLLQGAGSGVVSTTQAVGQGPARVGHVGIPLGSAEGVWIATLLLGLTFLAGLPLGVALRHPEGQRITTWGVGASLVGFSLVAGFSVGLAYLPAGLVLVAAAVLSPPRGRP